MSESDWVFKIIYILKLLDYVKTQCSWRGHEVVAVVVVVVEVTFCFLVSKLGNKIIVIVFFVRSVI